MMRSAGDLVQETEDVAIWPASSVTATSKPTTSGSALSGPRPQVKRACWWCASTSPAREKTKPGNWASTAAMLASMASRPSEPELAGVRDALRQVLAGHEPYPAVVVDRWWELLDSNAGLARAHVGGRSAARQPDEAPRC